MISVCIATYNGEKYIKEEIESILTQLGCEDEIIVSDDGSTDTTLEIIRGFNDPRIKIVSHNKEKALYKFDYTTHNFENALSYAKGDYIFLADQDDVWLPDKVNVTLEALRNNDIAISDCEVVDKNLNEIKPSRFTKSRPSVKISNNILSCNNPGCCMAFRRCVLNTVLPFPKAGVAHDLWIAVYGAIFHNVEFIDKPLILFRRHDGNVSESMGKSTASLSYKLSYRLKIMNAFLRRAGLMRFIRNFR